MCGGRPPYPLTETCVSFPVLFFFFHSSVPVILEPHCLAQPLCCYTGTMADWLTADVCIRCEQYLLNMASSQQQSIPLRRISWPWTKLEWLPYISPVACSVPEVNETALCTDWHKGLNRRPPCWLVWAGSTVSIYVLWSIIKHCGF